MEQNITVDKAEDAELSKFSIKSKYKKKET